MFGHTFQPGQQLIFFHLIDGERVDLTAHLILQAAEFRNLFGVDLHLNLHHLTEILFHIFRMLLHQAGQRFSLDQIHMDGPAPINHRKLMNHRHRQSGILHPNGVRASYNGLVLRTPSLNSLMQVFPQR